jgi:hypothetical protein
MNRCVNRHNGRIWGSEQPNEIHEYVRGKTKTSDISSRFNAESVEMFNSF